LRGSDGSELTLARYRGKVVLMSFGFTNCAAVCPITLATLAQARGALGAAADDVQVVFVTVDPERDAAPRLKTYLAAFDNSFVGATGTPEALAAMRKSYGVVARKVPMVDGYAMDHTSSVFLVDREGKLRALMPYGREARDFVHDVKLLLAK
jgi:protein SCO1/2